MKLRAEISPSDSSEPGGAMNLLSELDTAPPPRESIRDILHRLNLAIAHLPGHDDVSTDLPPYQSVL